MLFVITASHANIGIGHSHYNSIRLILCRHLKRKHDAVFKSYTQQRDSSKLPGQPTVDGFLSVSNNNKYATGHPEQQRITHLLVQNLIVKGSLPLGIVETEWFRGFMAAANPKYSLPSRSHLTSKLIPQLVQATEARISDHIVKSEHVALTLDIWTDRRMHSFLALTGHTFNNFESQSFLLAFEAFRGSHTGQNIAEAIDCCLSKYSLHDKVRYVVTDNASNMRKAFCVLADFVREADMDITALDVDDHDLWNDMEAADVDDDVSLLYSATGTGSGVFDIALAGFI